MNEIILQNCDVIYCSAGQKLTGADILVQGNRIAQVGPRLSGNSAPRVIDCSGKVVLPGLVNAHHHFFQLLTRCLPGGQNAGLFDWLNYHYGIWQHIRVDEFRAAYRAAIAELLLTGCTTTADHLYLFPKGISEDLLGLQAEVATELGIRFCGTRGSMTMGRSRGGLPPDEICEDDDEVLSHCESSVQKYHDPSPCSMCQIHFAPCSPFNVSEYLLRATARLARKCHVRLHTHLAETQNENEFCRAKYGCRPLELMERVEWLGDDVWFAHGIHFNDEEIATLGRSHSGICHCPTSNMRLSSGGAKINALREAGASIGLGVDGSASNDSSNMLSELRQALLLTRFNHGPDAMTAEAAIALGTEGSAALLGRTEIGKLEPGMAADIAIFDVSTLAYAGAFDPLAALLMCGYDQRAWMVIINGKIVVEKRELVVGHEEEINRDVRVAANKLWKRSGLIG